MNKSLASVCSCASGQKFGYEAFTIIAVDLRRWADLYRCKICCQYWEVTMDKAERGSIHKKLTPSDVLQLYGDPETKKSAHEDIRWK